LSLGRARRSRPICLERLSVGVAPARLCRAIATDVTRASLETTVVLEQRVARSLLFRRFVRRAQLQTAFLLVVLATAVFHLRECGALGAAVAQHLALTIGTFGTTLLEVALLGSALILGTPRALTDRLSGAGVAAFRALGAGLDQGVNALTRRLDPDRGSMGRRGRVADQARPPADTTTKHSELARPWPAPREHELRTTLHHLGFDARQIDGVLPSLDPGKEFAAVLRDALRILRATPSLPT
jgi:hypothetical protein